MKNGNENMKLIRAQCIHHSGVCNYRAVFKHSGSHVDCGVTHFWRMTHRSIVVVIAGHNCLAHSRVGSSAKHYIIIDFLLENYKWLLLESENDEVRCGKISLQSET